MIIKRTTNTHRDFLTLTCDLDAELKTIYGLLQAVYDRHNVLDPIDTAIVGYVNTEPMACGCFKKVDTERVEIKRLYVKLNFRRKGFSLEVLQALEAWAVELGYATALLETGKRQPEAKGFIENSVTRLLKTMALIAGWKTASACRSTLPDRTSAVSTAVLAQHYPEADPRWESRPGGMRLLPNMEIVGRILV